MKIDIPVNTAVASLTYGGLTFYKFGETASWTPNDNDDKYKFAKGAKVFFSQVISASITFKVGTTVEIDETVTLLDYNGYLYGMLKPVGGRGAC